MPLGTFDLSTLNGKNGFSLPGLGANDHSGVSVSSAGDFNDDGVGDFIIGAYAASPGNRTVAGSTFVVFGKTGSHPSGIFDLSSLNGTNGFRADGITGQVPMGHPGDQSGNAVSGGGDVNGDGISDIVIGAVEACYSTPCASSIYGAGSTYVLFGQKELWNSTFQFSILNGTNGFRLDSIINVDESGGSVSFIGDINNDGIDDLTVSAGFGGHVYVVFGHTSSWNASFPFSNLDGSNGFTITTTPNIGGGVRNIGDINGDGVADLVIGFNSDSPNGQTLAGSTYVIFGRTGLGSSGSFDLSSLDGTNGFKIVGSAGEYSGYSFCSADINRNGIVDLILSAVGASPNNKTNAGNVYILFGKNTTNWDPIFNLTALNGTNGFVLTGVSERDFTGSAVNNAGDINADGVDDIIIGAPSASPNNKTQAGASYVVFGKIGIGSTGIIDLAALDGTNGFTILKSSANDYDFIGWSLSNAGDVNADGITDLIIGAPHVAAASINPGNSYVVFGARPPQLLINQLTVNQGETLLLSTKNFNTTDVRYASTDVFFTVTDVQHGNFSWTNITATINNFSQSNVQRGEVVFIHDGSVNAPNYTVSVSNLSPMILPSQAGVVSFDLLPVLVNNALTVNQRQTVVLNSQMLSATDPDNPAAALTFSISNLQHGQFSTVSQPAVFITTFQQNQITAQQIQFTQDGTTSPSSYFVSVSDGRAINQGGPQAAQIQFNSYPSLLSNHYAITQGGKPIISFCDLSATDRETPAPDLTFVPSNLQHGIFQLVNQTGIALTTFRQQQVIAGQIQFAHDGSDVAPSFQMAVNDSSLTSTPQLAQIDFVPVGPSGENTNSNSVLVGAAVGVTLGVASLIGLGVLYTRNKAKQTLEQAIEDSGNRDGAFRRNTFSPIVKEIYKHIKISGCLGGLDKNTADRFIGSIQVLVEELQKQSVDLDLERMAPENKGRFLSEIVHHIRFYAIPRSNMRCSRFFKAEVTPTHIEDKAHAIAQGVANVVNSKPTPPKENTLTNVGIDDPKQPGLKDVFGDEKINETEMKYMHMKSS